MCLVIRLRSAAEQLEQLRQCGHIMRFRPSFRLRSLFLLTMVCAWCAWQWSISETRFHAATELTKHRFGVYHDDFIRVQGLWQLNDTPEIETTAPPTPDDIFKAGLIALSGTQLGRKQYLDPFRASIAGAVVGWDNWRQ